MIPPPRRRSDVQEDESFDVEERLKSLLDYDVDGFSEEEYDDDMDEDTKGVDALNKLDAIGYMVSLAHLVVKHFVKTSIAQLVSVWFRE